MRNRIAHALIVMFPLIMQSTAVMADWYNPGSWFKEGWAFASAAVAKYSENTYNNAVSAASNTVDAATRGDFDAVASEVVKLSVGPAALGPFRDTVLNQVNAVAPQQIKKYTETATDIMRKIDDGGKNLKGQVYMNLYKRYKNDGDTLYKRLRSGNTDFSEYYRYSLYYALATADWGHPAASAERIARDQWAAYSWYSAHTVKGATIGTVRNEVGLTDAAIEEGLRKLVNDQAANPNLGAVGVLIATEFVRIAKEAQCRADPVYCAQPGQRICGAPTEQHTVSVGNKTNGSIWVNMHVVSTQSHCQNHVCDISGELQPGERKACAVFGRRDVEQVQINVKAYRPGAPTDNPGVPLLYTSFNKAAGNSIDILYSGGKLCLDCGNEHVCGNQPDWFQFLPNPSHWANQPPANTIRDARGQFVCAAMDRPGIGRVFQDNNKQWICQFGHDGREHSYTSNFAFLSIDPSTVDWKRGMTPRMIRSTAQGNPAICRTNPGGGWSHMEFGWVHRDQCVLGWGGRSPSFSAYETLFAR